MLFLILLLLLVLFVFGGSWSYDRWGAAVFSPATLILVILLILWATGHLRCFRC